MLLTLSQPPVPHLSSGVFASGTLNDFAPRFSSAPRLSPRPRTDSPVSSLRASPPVIAIVASPKMSTPHRGLPPPAAMELPPPNRLPPQPPPLPPPQLTSQPMGAMPAPPGQWHGQEESMRGWLATKSEEERRRQEEEKTKQESYRLEQRRIEQSMLRESLQAGMPPSLVPIIYAGLGGPSLVNMTVEWLQQYAAQLQASSQQHHQHHHHTSPETRHAVHPTTTLPPPLPAHQASLPPHNLIEPPPPHSGSMQGTFPAYTPQHQAPQRSQVSTSAPRSSAQSQLPRLTTGDLFVPQPAQTSVNHRLQQSQPPSQQEQASSPSIYFHHWVPPTETAKSSGPQTPAKSDPQPNVPGSGPGSGSLLSEPDLHSHKDSPRKRKAMGAHHANPPPSGAPLYASPSFSVGSSASSRRTGQPPTRSRSNTSTTRESEPHSRPASRRDADSTAPVASTPARPPPLQEERAVRRVDQEHTSGAATAGRAATEVIRSESSSETSVPRELERERQHDRQPSELGASGEGRQ